MIWQQKKVDDSQDYVPYVHLHNAGEDGGAGGLQCNGHIEYWRLNLNIDAPRSISLVIYSPPFWPCNNVGVVATGHSTPRTYSTYNYNGMQQRVQWLWVWVKKTP